MAMFQEWHHSDENDAFVPCCTNPMLSLSNNFTVFPCKKVVSNGNNNNEFLEAKRRGHSL
jgi:hypothetical protein